MVRAGNYNLFLDDTRMPEDVFGYTGNQLYLIGWEIVRNYDEFKAKIENNGIPAMISFDHDLGFDEFLKHDYEGYDPENEKTGHDCARWLINYCLDNDLKIPGDILIHSKNGVGAKNIKSLFDTYKKMYGED